MGIDSREYLRDDDDGSYGGQKPVAQMSIVTKIIIGTVVVFALQVLSSNGPQQLSTVEQWMILNGRDLFHGQVWRLLSYAFLHMTSSPLHIVMNMYMLYMLGRATAQLTGEREFLWFYCVSAVFAGMCSALFYGVMRIDPNVLGASGAVMAVFTLFAMHYPKQKLYLFGVLGIEVRWLLAAYVVIDVYPVISALDSRQLGDSGTAHSAHVGGLLFGWLYFRWNMRFTTWLDRLAGRASTGIRARKSGLKVYNPKTTPDPDLSAHVDKILAKISEEGEGSLTDRERRILRQASDQMKKRR
jgi:membrane associated rhomboid family serine protease